MKIKTKWWHRLFLWILPTWTVTEYGDGFKSIVVFKKWFGKKFVLDVSRYEN